MLDIRNALYLANMGDCTEGAQQSEMSLVRLKESKNEFCAKKIRAKRRSNVKKSEMIFLLRDRQRAHS